MLVQELVLDNETRESQGLYEQHFSSMSKYSRSDVRFPMPVAATRRRVPSITAVKTLADQHHDAGQSIGSLDTRAPDLSLQDIEQPDPYIDQQHPFSSLQSETEDERRRPRLSLDDLPLEVQGRILDHIFGDMHSIYAGSTSLRGKSVSSLMRHPRRKAVSDLALVSHAWRGLVQERIYRHIKIKGTRAGLAESEAYFVNHMHLISYVRHIEFWVPVWGDKAALDHRTLEPFIPANDRRITSYFAQQANESLIPANDLLGFSFKLSAYTATLSEIFSHIACFFPHARVFTLEGGHCKKSNMIRHFPKTLFPRPDQALEKLPNIRTFAMRGAWNVMREYSHWQTIEQALPNVQEWHCGYAKPRPEADMTINNILSKLPNRFRHVNISLDGMYSKDPTTLGSSFSPGQSHLCERIGRVLPRLESLSYTGKICECMWSSALSALRYSKQEPRLKALEIVVKSCCRQRVTDYDPETGETIVHELGGVIADGAGITNLVFIRAFERLVLETVQALPYFPHLDYIRIRFIDLDSPCTLLNPYWLMEKGVVYGIWNEEIVERLAALKPNVQYEELGDGIEYAGWQKGHARNMGSTSSADTGGDDADDAVSRPPTGLGPVIGATSPVNNMGAGVGVGGGQGSCSLYPKWRPRSIKTSSYRIVADARGA
ncbi:hypothetical protein PV10_02177 [Exophiala mesophila]|uniref:Uncharacterized protein n=1 Tax=Exophiala mesophila TaxID=212818 RepID=A0A0D1WY71_EXOME|nr:uncharacterized protein PV10_02177 [Exophiala mesophila]KIV94410.1 hypothetical protein PV10_02177 [Exophiala mesophila]